MWHQWRLGLFSCVFPPCVSSKQMDVWNLLIMPYIYITLVYQGTLTCRTSKVGKLIDWLVCLFIHPSIHLSSILIATHLPPPHLPIHPSIPSTNTNWMHTFCQGLGWRPRQQRWKGSILLLKDPFKALRAGHSQKGDIFKPQCVTQGLPT